MRPVIQLRPHQQRALDALIECIKGQVIIPTGGGKTLVGICDAMREFQSDAPKTIVVVAPRILLAEQLSAEYLEFITNAAVLHVHSGETHHFSTTKPSEIRQWNEIVTRAFNPDAPKHKLIFTTPCNVFSRQTFTLIPFISMKRTIPSNVTFSLLRSTSLLLLTAAISSLLLLSILLLFPNLV
jgi:N12 class adenine-specific DNA methylase